MMTSALPAKTTNRNAAAALSLAFALTGFGVALPGAALPALLAHWHLQDRGGGLLFLLAWLGSTVGAVLARGSQLHSVVRGALLTCAASLLLARVPNPWIYPAVLAYGMGLGIMMTSVSLLRARQTAMASSLTNSPGGEGRTAHTPTHEMNRLNMIWAVGALACPSLTAQALRTSSPGPLLATVGAIFGAVAAAVYLTGRKSVRNGETEVHTPEESVEALGVQSSLHDHATRTPTSRDLPRIWRCSPVTLPTVPIRFALFAALTVGLESALGGWLTTYAQRAQHGVSAVVSVTTAFWAGLLLSRALHTTRWVHAATPARWLQAHAALTLASVCLIAITHETAPLLGLALLAGIGLGPLYPITLGFVLPRYRGRLIFVLAGLGSAFFPWLTGLLSTELQSIRKALVVCCLASLGMAALTLMLRSTIVADSKRPTAFC